MQLAESAVKKYLDASSIGATVYTGIDDEDKELPCVVVRAGQAEEEIIGSNNFRLPVDVTIKAAAGSSDFETICTSVRDFLWLEAEDLGTQLTQQESELLVRGATAARTIARDVSGDSWTETQQLTLICAPWILA